MQVKQRKEKQNDYRIYLLLLIHNKVVLLIVGIPTPNLGANCPLTMFSYELYFSDTVPGISPLLNIISRLSNMYSIWRAAGQTRGKLPRHDILLFAPHARISRPSASVMYQTQTFEILDKWWDTA